MSELDESANELELVGSGLRWNRREMLKKTAIAGGVIVWSIPAIELIGSGIAAAASAPGLGANCTITVPGVSSLLPSVGNTTTVTITYTTSTTTGTETVTIANSSEAGVTITPSGSGDFVFTLNGNDTILATPEPSGDTITVVSVIVSGQYQGTINGTYANCNPFAIKATG
jgi:hypothetical protein